MREGDPEKSTIAAAKYLKDLYDMFECWYLAAAGYKRGRSQDRQGNETVPDGRLLGIGQDPLPEKGDPRLCPQIIAAAVIAKDPEQYGFTSIGYEKPLRYEKSQGPRGYGPRCHCKGLRDLPRRT